MRRCTIRNAHCNEIRFPGLMKIGFMPATVFKDKPNLFAVERQYGEAVCLSRFNVLSAEDFFGHANR